jgi:hypothetical protein
MNIFAFRRFGRTIRSPIGVNATATRNPDCKSRGKAPAAANELTVSVAVCVLFVVSIETEAGETPQETFVVLFAGTAHDRATLPAKPLAALTVTVNLPLCPTAGIVEAAGLAATENVGVDTNPGQDVIRLKTSSEPIPDAWS